MSYKQMDNNFSFTDLSLADSMEKNRSLSRMEKINAIINWSSVESLLLKHYTVGKNIEGAAACAGVLQNSLIISAVSCLDFLNQPIRVPGPE